MVVMKILLLFACVALSFGGETIQEESRGGGGSTESDGEQAALLQRTLDTLQSTLAEMLAVPAQLWATHADEVRARTAALQDQVVATKEQLTAVLAAAQQRMALSAEQFRAEHPELQMRVDEARRLLFREEQAGAEGERYEQQHPEAPHEAEAERAFHELASGAARAREALARIWRPDPAQ